MKSVLLYTIVLCLLITLTFVSCKADAEITTGAAELAMLESEEVLDTDIESSVHFLEEADSESLKELNVFKLLFPNAAKGLNGKIAEVGRKVQELEISGHATAELERPTLSHFSQSQEGSVLLRDFSF